MNKLLLTALLLVTPMIVSCGSTAKPRPPSVALEAGARVHVVKHANSSRDIDLYLRNSFAKRGYPSTSGAQAEMPSGTQFYVTYVDRWYWDLAMYLLSLDVTMHDAKSGSVINSSRYKNGFFHTYPSPEKKSDELVARLLGKMK